MSVARLVSLPHTRLWILLSSISERARQSLGVKRPLESFNDLPYNTTLFSSNLRCPLPQRTGNLFGFPIFPLFLFAF